MKTIYMLIVLALLAVPAIAQQQGPEDDTVCISQDAAQQCASCAAERKGLRELADTLKTARDNDTRIIRDLELRLAVEVQKAADLQAEVVRQQALIQFLLTNGRKKIRIGLINF